MGDVTKQENSLTTMLRPYVEAIRNDVWAGDVKAKSIVALYRMYVDCPSNRAAAAICEEVFKEWRKTKETPGV